MKVSEIRGMRADELNGKLEDLRKQLFTLRSQAVTEKVENTRAVKNARKDIARVLTVINQKKAEENKGS